MSHLEIRLGGKSGGATLVDADLSADLLCRKWRRDRDGYVVTSNIDGSIFLHRQVMGAQRGELVDHIDRDPLNNTRANLRVVTARENNLNRSAKKRGTSRFKGLSWVPKARKWQVLVDNKYIGLFADELEAATVWLSHAERVFGLVNVAQDRARIERCLAERSA